MFDKSQFDDQFKKFGKNDDEFYIDLLENTEQVREANRKINYHSKVYKISQN